MLTGKIDNRKLKGVYKEILRMLDPKGKRGLTVRAIRHRYYTGDLEVVKAHQRYVDQLAREKREALKITDEVRGIVEDTKSEPVISINQTEINHGKCRTS